MRSKILLFITLFLFLKIFNIEYLFATLFEQQESGYLFENLYSLNLQNRYLGVGYVNNAVKEAFSLNFLNPALVYDIAHQEVSISYFPIVSNNNFYYANFSSFLKIKEKKLPLSFSILNFTSAPIEKTNIFNESYGYTFYETINCINFSLSYPLKKLDCNIGFNLKNYFQTIDDYFSYSNNIDIGVLTPLEKQYSWGISYLNVIPKTFGTDKFSPILRASLNHYIVDIFFSNLYLLFEFDLIDFYDFNKTTYRWGIATIYDLLFIPLSLSFSISSYGINLGFDIEVYNLNISYAITKNELAILHRFSLNYKFNFFPEEYHRQFLQKIKEIEKQKKMFLKEVDLKTTELKNLKKEYELQKETAKNILIAKNLIFEKKYIEAKKILEKTLEITPNDPYALEMYSLVKAALDKETIKLLYIEAKNLYEKGNYQLAKEKLRKILDLEPSHNLAKNLLNYCDVFILINEKKYKEAKSLLFEIIKENPDETQAFELIKKVETLIELETTPEE